MPETATTTSTTTRSGDLILWITYLNIVLYALSYQLQTPVEPFLVQELSSKQHSTTSASDENDVRRTYGNLRAFFSAIQTIGSPLVGILLDRIGIRYASAAVFFSSALSYAILSQATSLEMLFYSKIPTALQHAFLVAQAAAATSTQGNESARAQALGRMTTAYTIGATLGPALGGYLANAGDLYLGAKYAVIGSLVSVLLSLLYYPNVSHQKQQQETLSDNNNNKPSGSASFLEQVRDAVALAMRSSLWPLLVVKVVGGITSSMTSTVLPMILTQDLEFDPSELGNQYSVTMAAVAVFGAFCMLPITRTLGASGMARIGLGLRAILGLFLAAVVAVAYTSSNEKDARYMIQIQIMTATVLQALASHALATGLTTQTTGAVEAHEQGALLGLEHGLFSGARVVGPGIGTRLLGSGGGGSTGFWRVSVACFLVDGFLLGLLFVKAKQIAVGGSTSAKHQKEPKND